VAGWASGWEAWPAGARDNHGKPARFCWAAWPEAVGVRRRARCNRGNQMSHVRVLQAIRYPEGDASHLTASPPEAEAVEQVDPSWEDIERAIRRLDRREYPYVWLCVCAPISGEEPLGLNIMGGRGEYAVSISLPGQLVYFADGSRSGNLVRIWETDQGSTLPESSLCGDTDRVLSIARYFTETGKPDPSEKWVE
jgi:hypothetical protein